MATLKNLFKSHQRRLNQIKADALSVTVTSSKDEWQAFKPALEENLRNQFAADLPINIVFGLWFDRIPGQLVLDRARDWLQKKSVLLKADLVLDDVAGTYSIVVK